MLRLVLSTMALATLAGGAFAQESPRPQVSQCQLIAEKIPNVQYANFTPPASGAPALTLAQVQEDVVITFVGHSTFQIDTPGGISIATDFNGWLRTSRTPDVVTMNNAHSTHWTSNPDPRIPHVLKGWPEKGSPAFHELDLGGMLVRNVTTDTRGPFGEGARADGNSIFVFEAGGLCIGHLGHLHQIPDDAQYASIGRLDVVMVPVDGGYTMAVSEMAEVVRRLRSSVVIPMHWFSGASLQVFLKDMEGEFQVVETGGPDLELSRQDLPGSPTIMVLEPDLIP